MAEEVGMALPNRVGKIQNVSEESRWKCPAFKASGIFSSHMVLQRDQPIAVWGFSDAPGSAVKGEFMGEEAQTRVDGDNGWKLVFPAREYTRTPQTMRLWDDRGHEVFFDDILIGDVWVIGGQSNAELHLKPCMYLTPEVGFSENDSFRLFPQTQQFVGEHVEMSAEPWRDIANPEWKWQRPGEEASLDFSAMGWYFAQEVTGEIDVPLGMVMAAAGGACLREMVPEALAHAEGYYYGANVPIGAYYNMLIHPLYGLKFKGMLFFQGESEGCEKIYADNYREDLSLLVYDERKGFDYQFPFYFVQLSDYPGEGDKYFPYLDIVRTQQFDAVKTIEGSAMTVDMDLGAPEDYADWAHSPRKKELAHRLARLVLAREYGIGREDQVSSPVPEQAALSEDGKKIAISFTNTAGGLKIVGKTCEESAGKELPGFSVGPYASKVPARAVLTDGNTVTVDVPEGADASMVGYAFFRRVNAGNANLYNAVDLPCPAFQIEVK